MRKDILLRRGTHFLIALTPLYYALPEQLPVLGIHRWYLVVAFFVGICLFEAYRLKKGITFLGLRPHEKSWIASFVWAAAGITAVLWLCPHDIASASLVGMAFVDPLAGELRRARGSKVAVSMSILAYFAIAFPIMYFWELRPPEMALFLAAVGAIAAVASEHYKVKYIDDDFLMLVVPALLMTALSMLG